ncbi:MAG TPA: hypothetical protein VKD04_03865 [Burkholderiales bacterium]|nr:hypothetical protein [Burkholderiales bacterium]
MLELAHFTGSGGSRSWRRQKTSWPHLSSAMLATTGIIATGVCRGVAMHPRLLSGTAPRHAWTAALAVTGVLLMALR